MSSPAISPSASFCPQCGSRLNTNDRFCQKCGNSLSTISQPPPAMSTRTESTVLSVGPSSENECIKEMETFGWNLHSRQEVLGHLRVAEAPDRLGQAIWRGAVEGATGKKTYEYDHYVKLHFTRNLNTPRLEEVKALEAEYFGLPYPQGPSLTWPVILTGFFAIGVLLTLFGGIPLQFLLEYLPLAGLCAWWTSKRLKRRRAATEACEQSVGRAQKIRAQVQVLIG